MSAAAAIAAPPIPRARLSLGITGHRASNNAFLVNRQRVAVVIADIFDILDAAVASATVQPAAPTRLHSLLADGVDLLAADAGLARGWALVSPLPFGRNLNVAINAMPGTAADARALLVGADAADADTQARAAAIRQATAISSCFELADRDDIVAERYLDKLDAPADMAKAEAFGALCAERVALAGRVMIEQSDIIIGIWDGRSTAMVGGTGHTIFVALEHGAPVVWIDANSPEDWRILYAPEALAAPLSVTNEDREANLALLARSALHPEDLSPAEASEFRAGVEALNAETWHGHSNRWGTAYRRIEAIFGGDGRPFRSLRQTYENPDTISSGSGARMLAIARALPDADLPFIARVETDVLRRFAWSDAISAQLSDSYRSGMVTSFVFSAAAIISGIAYQPLASSDQKWLFAIIEFLLLGSILLITWLGQKRRWHGRWFETRRVAEYFRHAPTLLLLGVARPPGRWPKGSETSWPEYYARHGLRAIGLPRVALSPAYLRAALASLLDDHVVRQRDYHEAKARRLTSVHHRLDGLSETSFRLAVASVTLYLTLSAAAAMSILQQDTLHSMAKAFTFLGVFFPTAGAAIAGVRYFGDFERFAAISEVTAEKLNAVHTRITLLLAAPDSGIDYARVSELAHATDDIVITEIENWQSVFGGKHITVPA